MEDIGSLRKDSRRPDAVKKAFTALAEALRPALVELVNRTEAHLNSSEIFTRVKSRLTELDTQFEGRTATGLAGFEAIAMLKPEMILKEVEAEPEVAIPYHACLERMAAVADPQRGRALPRSLGEVQVAAQLVEEKLVAAQPKRTAAKLPLVEWMMKGIATEDMMTRFPAGKYPSYTRSPKRRPEEARWVLRARVQPQGVAPGVHKRRSRRKRAPGK